MAVSILFLRESTECCKLFSFIRSLRKRSLVHVNFFRRRENFGNARWGRRDRFRPKIIEIRAIFVIFRPFEDLRRLLEDLQGLEGRHETSEKLIWRSREFLSATIKFVSENYPMSPEIQPSATFSAGVKVVLTICWFEFSANDLQFFTR